MRKRRPGRRRANPRRWWGRGRRGSGGNVVIWSDQHTVFAGAISVTGGALGGDGGFVETSSHGVLAFDGTADRFGAEGQAGPAARSSDLDIVAAGTSSIQITNGTGTATRKPSNSTLTVTDLQNALGQGNVILQTSGTLRPASGLGNIDVDASFSWATASSLTLSAFNSINFASGVTATNTKGGSVTLRADNTGIGGVSGAGLNAGFGEVTFAGGKQIKLSGGATGNISTLYNESTTTGGSPAPINYGTNVTLGGKLTPFELCQHLTQLQAISNVVRETMTRSEQA